MLLLTFDLRAGNAQKATHFGAYAKGSVAMTSADNLAVSWAAESTYQQDDHCEVVETLLLPSTLRSMTALSDLLNDSNIERWSARRIQADAERSGVHVANTSISKYLRGEPEKPSEHVLQAFSVALEIPMVKLREAAGVPAGEIEQFVLPPQANRLTQRQREAILHLIRVFLNEERLD